MNPFSAMRVDDVVANGIGAVGKSHD